MKLIDTMVLIVSINPKDKRNPKAMNHLDAVTQDAKTFVPAPVLIEFELELMSHGFNEDQVRTVLEDLSAVIPTTKVLSQSVISMLHALALYRSGMTYFDSLIAGMAQESDATVITADKAVAKVVKTEW
ncbi:MAG: putative nucleic-acid-binding protein [Candidatus Nitrosomirales archaeon]|jgi:predicted nucleic-acid-binding protein